MKWIWWYFENPPTSCK